MKIIVAGHQKTGTKTLTEALRILGYNVYDFVENCHYLGKEWKQIFKNGGSTELFRSMYENVDAVSDVPSFPFWEEIHKAFPDSQVILSVRDNEDEWLRSISHQIQTNIGHVFLNLVYFFSPTFIFNMAPIGGQAITLVYGIDAKSLVSSRKINETILRMSYRRHNAHVLQNAPKDKLLVYNCKEGWEPLCKFLGVEVPSVPFPHKNKAASIFDEFFESNEVMITMKREAVAVVALLITATAVGVYGGLKHFSFI